MSKRNKGQNRLNQEVVASSEMEINHETVEETDEVEETTISDEVIENTGNLEDSSRTDDTKPKKELLNGVVFNCSGLNLRANPTINDKVVAIVQLGDNLVVDLEKSTEEWYRVYTTSGIEGYCMKKYVMIQK